MFVQKSSFLFLLILLCVGLIGAYNALFPMPAGQVFIRFFALSALFLICVSLIIGPLAVIDIRYASLIEPRRAVGISAFIFTAIHVLLALDFVFGWNIGAVLGVFPQAISIPAALILLAMALTSSDWAVKKMGMGKWKTVQYFIYPAFVLILVHFILLSNGLFAKTPNGVFVNLSEVGVLALCAITIALQACGFYLKRKRMSEAAFAAAPTTAN